MQKRLSFDRVGLCGESGEGAGFQNASSAAKFSGGFGVHNAGVGLLGLWPGAERRRFGGSRRPGRQDGFPGEEKYLKPHL